MTSQAREFFDTREQMKQNLVKDTGQSLQDRNAPHREPCSYRKQRSSMDLDE